MKLLFVISIVLLSIFAGQIDAGKDSCTFDFCQKELSTDECRDASKMTREQCINQGELYITYRTSVLSGSSNKCCNFRMAEIRDKYLYCVRVIASATKICTSESIKYKTKIKTLEQCNTLSCI